MEKRTFLAIIISIIILFTYNSLFLKPQKETPAILETIVAEQVTIESRDLQRPETIVKSDDISFVEEVKIIETPLLVLEFSNRGGTLKSVTIKEFNEKLPVTDIFSVSGYENLPFVLQETYGNVVAYLFKDQNFEIQKIYDLSNQDHEIKFDLKVKNITEMSNVKDIFINVMSIQTKEIANNKDLGRERGLYEYSFNVDNSIKRTGNAFKFSSKNETSIPGQVSWLAFRDRYFCAIIKPQFTTQRIDLVSPEEHQLDFKIKLSNQIIGQGDTASFSSLAYFGPQDIEKLTAYGQGYEDIIVFSRFWIMDFISKTIIRIMYFIYRIIPNWGIAIILVSILVYAAMYPLTAKSMVSMRKMQSLQPEIAKIKEKNKNNPQKVNQEVLEIYKKQGVNPLGGCLPFLLQMPVFIGLYQALWRSVMFKGAGFLWIKDLSEPDRLFILPFEIPFIGNEVNILPILMIIIMFMQQKFSARNVVSTDPNQIMQQKMMTIIFPVMLGFIFYKFASGLTLYFTMFYLFSAVSQWRMSKVKALV